MKSAVAILFASALALTGITAAAAAPEPFTGSGATPYDWTGAAGLEGLTEFQASLLLASQASLPLTLDEVTTLVAVSWDGTTFVYDYALALASDAGFDIDAFKAAQLSVFCAGLVEMQRPGELDALRYRYLTTDEQTLVIDITGADCAIV